MNIILKQPIADSSAWNAETFMDDDTWIYHLTQHDIDDVHQAVLVAKSTGKLIHQLTSNDFPLRYILFAILGPTFPKHSGGPGQMERLTPSKMRAKETLCV